MNFSYIFLLYDHAPQKRLRAKNTVLFNCTGNKNPRTKNIRIFLKSLDKKVVLPKSNCLNLKTTIIPDMNNNT